MKLDALTVALRPRSSWEAVELGTALVRRHAGAIWRPWLALTLPAFVLGNAVAMLLGLPWLAAVVMWWLKPLFDRVPLFVLSHAVFGDVPGTRVTLRGAFRGGGRAMAGYLAWRRLSPARSLLMPVDVLEGGDASQAGARRRVLAGPAYGVASLTLLVFLHFELVLVLGIGMLAFVFVPSEYLRPSAELIWQHLRESPPWLLLVENALVWMATSVLEPFYVGSGFGLYLNRRVEIEGWDIEIAFRRLRARLLPAGAGLALLAALWLPLPSQAMPQCPRPGQEAASMRAVFGDAYRVDPAFDRAVEEAFEGPELHPQRTVTTWVPKRPGTPGRLPPWLSDIGRLVALLGEGVLWALALGLVALLGFTARRWWPWLRGFAGEPAAMPAAPVDRAVEAPPPLPADIVAAARRHWQAGRAREALALVYRAAVEAMLAATGRVLPPGATEAQCLRAATALPAAQREAFGLAVRQWQHAAYAARMPGDADFEAMLAGAASAFGWTR